MFPFCFHLILLSEGQILASLVDSSDQLCHGAELGLPGDLWRRWRERTEAGELFRWGDPVPEFLWIRVITPWWTAGEHSVPTSPWETLLCANKFPSVGRLGRGAPSPASSRLRGGGPHAGRTWVITLWMQQAVFTEVSFVWGWLGQRTLGWLTSFSLALVRSVWWSWGPSTEVREQGGWGPDGRSEADVETENWSKHMEDGDRVSHDWAGS